MTKEHLLGCMRGFKSIERPLPNMVVVRFDNGSVLYSYDTIIGVKILDQYFFDKKVHDDEELFSRTTMKHQKQWCGMPNETVEKLADNPKNNFVCWYNE